MNFLVTCLCLQKQASILAFHDAFDQIQSHLVLCISLNGPHCTMNHSWDKHKHSLCCEETRQCRVLASTEVLCEGMITSWGVCRLASLVSASPYYLLKICWAMTPIAEPRKPLATRKKELKTDWLGTQSKEPIAYLII